MNEAEPNFFSVLPVRLAALGNKKICKYTAAMIQYVDILLH